MIVTMAILISSFCKSSLTRIWSRVSSQGIRSPGNLPSIGAFLPRLSFGLEGLELPGIQLHCDRCFFAALTNEVRQQVENIMGILMGYIYICICMCIYIYIYIYICIYSICMYLYIYNLSNQQYYLKQWTEFGTCPKTRYLMFSWQGGTGMLPSYLGGTPGHPWRLTKGLFKNSPNHIVKYGILDVGKSFPTYIKIS